jgi:hypothetical protein
VNSGLEKIKYFGELAASYNWYKVDSEYITIEADLCTAIVFHFIIGINS